MLLFDLCLPESVAVDSLLRFRGCMSGDGLVVAGTQQGCVRTPGLCTVCCGWQFTCTVF